jgi:hypothetical protein
MKPEPFLIAASATQEYGWVLLPNSIPRSARGEVLRQLPSKVTPELAVINLNVAGKTAFAAVRTERTVDPQGNAVRDESGRLLRYTFGALFDRPIDARVAESEVDRLRPQVKAALTAFLKSPPEVVDSWEEERGLPPEPTRQPEPARVPDSAPDLSRPPPKVRFNRWLAIAVGLAVLVGALLLDLSLLGRVQTLSALAADRQSQLTTLERKNQELNARLRDDDDAIRWLLRAP